MSELLQRIQESQVPTVDLEPIKPPKQSLAGPVTVPSSQEAVQDLFASPDTAVAPVKINQPAPLPSFIQSQGAITPPSLSQLRDQRRFILPEYQTNNVEDLLSDFRDALGNSLNKPEESNRRQLGGLLDRLMYWTGFAPVDESAPQIGLLGHNFGDFNLDLPGIGARVGPSRALYMLANLPNFAQGLGASTARNLGANLEAASLSDALVALGSSFKNGLNTFDALVSDDAREERIARGNALINSFRNIDLENVIRMPLGFFFPGVYTPEGQARRDEFFRLTEDGEYMPYVMRALSGQDLAFTTFSDDTDGDFNPFGVLGDFQDFGDSGAITELPKVLLGISLDVALDPFGGPVKEALENSLDTLAQVLARNAYDTVDVIPPLRGGALVDFDAPVQNLEPRALFREQPRLPAGTDLIDSASTRPPVPEGPSPNLLTTGSQDLSPTALFREQPRLPQRFDELTGASDIIPVNEPGRYRPLELEGIGTLVPTRVDDVPALIPNRYLEGIIDAEVISSTPITTGYLDRGAPQRLLSGATDTTLSTLRPQLQHTDFIRALRPRNTNALEQVLRTPNQLVDVARVISDTDLPYDIARVSSHNVIQALDDKVIKDYTSVVTRDTGVPVNINVPDEIDPELFGNDLLAKRGFLSAIPEEIDITSGQTLKDIINTNGVTQEVDEKLSELVRMMYITETIHGDLTLDNILLGADGELKLLNTENVHRLHAGGLSNDFQHLEQVIREVDAPLTQQMLLDTDRNRVLKSIKEMHAREERLRGPALDTSTDTIPDEPLTFALKNMDTAEDITDIPLPEGASININKLDDTSFIVDIGTGDGILDTGNSAGTKAISDALSKNRELLDANVTQFNHTYIAYPTGSTVEALQESLEFLGTLGFRPVSSEAVTVSDVRKVLTGSEIGNTRDTLQTQQLFYIPDEVVNNLTDTTIDSGIKKLPPLAKQIATRLGHVVTEVIPLRGPRNRVAYKTSDGLFVKVLPDAKDIKRELNGYGLLDTAGLKDLGPTFVSKGPQHVISRTIEGKSLSDILEVSTVPDLNHIKAVKSITDTLAGKKLTHLDLHDSNIIIENTTGALRILDLESIRKGTLETSMWDRFSKYTIPKYQPHVAKYFNEDVLDAVAIIQKLPPKGKHTFYSANGIAGNVRKPSTLDNVYIVDFEVQGKWARSEVLSIPKNVRNDIKRLYQMWDNVGTPAFDLINNADGSIVVASASGKTSEEILSKWKSYEKRGIYTTDVESMADLVRGGGSRTLEDFNIVPRNTIDKPTSDRILIYTPNPGDVKTVVPETVTTPTALSKESKIAKHLADFDVDVRNYEGTNKFQIDPGTPDMIHEKLRIMSSTLDHYSNQGYEVLVPFPNASTWQENQAILKAYQNKGFYVRLNDADTIIAANSVPRRIQKTHDVDVVYLGHEQRPVTDWKTKRVIAETAPYTPPTTPTPKPLDKSDLKRITKTVTDRPTTGYTRSVVSTVDTQLPLETPDVFEKLTALRSGETFIPQVTLYTDEANSIRVTGTLNASGAIEVDFTIQGTYKRKDVTSKGKGGVKELFKAIDAARPVLDKLLDDGVEIHGDPNGSDWVEIYSKIRAYTRRGFYPTSRDGRVFDYKDITESFWNSNALISKYHGNNKVPVISPVTGQVTGFTNNVGQRAAKNILEPSVTADPRAYAEIQHTLPNEVRPETLDIRTTTLIDNYTDSVRNVESTFHVVSSLEAQLNQFDNLDEGLIDDLTEFMSSQRDTLRVLKENTDDVDLEAVRDLYNGLLEEPTQRNAQRYVSQVRYRLENQLEDAYKAAMEQYDLHETAYEQLKAATSTNNKAYVDQVFEENAAKVSKLIDELGQGNRNGCV